MFQSAPTTGIHVPGAMAHCTRVDIFFACAAARPLEKAMMICASNASEGAAVKPFGGFVGGKTGKPLEEPLEEQ